MRRLQFLVVAFLGELVVAFLLTSQAHAENLEINLAQHSAQLKYATSVGSTTYGRSEMSYGALYNNDKKANVVGVALMVVDNAGSATPGLEVGIGPKLWLATRDDYRALCLAIGGKLKFKVAPQDRFFARAAFFYAPSIVSFSDANNMHEISADLGYEILPTADMYVGYRSIKAEFPKLSDKTLDNSTYFGMHLRF